MTEEVWLTASDCEPLLKWLMRSKRHRPRRRKLHHFAMACILTRPGIPDTGYVAEVFKFTEEYNESSTPAGDTIDEWRRLFRLEEQEREAGTLWPSSHLVTWLLRITHPLFNMSPESCAQSVSGYTIECFKTKQQRTAAAQMHADFLRDVIGNPYRPVTCEPAWRTEAVIGIARLA